MILLHRNLLLLNTPLFSLQDVKLLFLPLDFLLAHFVLFFEFGYVLVASAHDFCIVVQESGILDQRLLQLVVFFSELRLSALELELLLGKVLLLGQVSLLVLVHFAALVEQSRRRRHSVKLLRLSHLLFNHGAYFCWFIL